MLNWYRATPIVVPAPDEVFAGPSVLDMPEENFMIRMPHQVIWGDRDQALRPSCLKGLDHFVPELTIEHIEGASHWVLHERPQAVADAIRRFVSP